MSRYEWDVRELLLQGFVRSTFSKMHAKAGIPDGVRRVEFERVSDKYTDGMWLGLVFVDRDGRLAGHTHLAREKLMPGSSADAVRATCDRVNQALSRSMTILALKS